MDNDSHVSDSKSDNLEEKIPGELSLLKLSNEELNDFIDYMKEVHGGTFLDLLYSIIGPDRILLYLEALEDLSVHIPSKKITTKIVFYIRIYNYLKHRDFTEDAYKRASKVYGKRVIDLKRIVSKVETVLKRTRDEEL